MNALRKILIPTHRYLGIALSLLYLMWFVSGIAMIYAKGMPSLTPPVLLERRAPIDFNRATLTLAQAAEKIDASDSIESAKLLTIMGRPVYRFNAGGGLTTVFADTGETLNGITAEQANQIAADFLKIPSPQLHSAEILNAPDQWTIGRRALMPLHKIVVDDPAHTELYISAVTGDVAVQTTRGTRALAWIAAIPHWLYFAPLRTRTALWTQVIIWTSLAASLSALIGLALAVIQYRRKRPHVPYAGLLRWHYITGAIFGVFTLTWVFSGFLSMGPWDWKKSGQGLGDGMPEALSGGPLETSQFPAPSSQHWNALRLASPLKEIEFLRIQGDSYYAARTADGKSTLVSAAAFNIRAELFSVESLVQRVRQPNPEAPVLETALLSSYDFYYYANDGSASLPVLRVKFGDPYSTWVYVDPKSGQLVGRYQRLERIERWVYHGFHSLDFPFWYYNRPLWDAGVIALCLGGAMLSAIGVAISFRRLVRAFR